MGTEEEQRVDLLSIKFQPHGYLVDTAFHLPFKDQANEKFLHLINLHIQLLHM